MPVETLSTAAEKKICAALVKTADFVADGIGPDEAIAKAAASERIPRGHLRLMVHAYNVGQTTRQREEGTTLAEKVAEFPIASLPGVLEILYPETVTTKAAAERASGVDPVYSQRPQIFREATSAATRGTSFTKAAEQAPSEAPRSATTATEAITRRIKRAKVLVEVRRATNQASDRFRESLEKLAAAFDAPTAPRLAEVRDNIQALHGDRGLVVLAYLGDSHPRLAKQASRGPQALAPVSAHPAIYAGFTEVFERHAKLAMFHDWYDAMLKEAERLDRVESAPFRLPPESILDQIELEKEAGFMDQLSGHVANVASSIEPPDADAATASALRKLSTPEHEQNLRAIQVRAMLHEMLHDDEILKGHDPYEVAHHFNRLSRYAPRLAEQPLAAIPAVRKSLQQGHLDSFDVREIADTEGKLRPAHGGSHGR